MKAVPIVSMLVGMTLALSGIPAQAQSSDSSCLARAKSSANAIDQLWALGRAKNVARQAAETANGGLTRYHAEDAMHGPLANVPCTANDNGTWTFTFKGGAPGATAQTVESVVTVDPTTWKVTVDYNGAIRQ